MGGILQQLSRGELFREKFPGGQKSRGEFHEGQLSGSKHVGKLLLGKLFRGTFPGGVVVLGGFQLGQLSRGSCSGGNVLIPFIQMSQLCSTDPCQPPLSPYQFFPCDFYKRRNQPQKLSDFQFEPFCHTGVKFQVCTQCQSHVIEGWS